MAETDLADWHTITVAAARIGCSTRTIERLGRAKKLEQRLRRQAGSPAVAVYNPDDVARIAAERQPAAAPFVLDAVRTPTNGNGQHTSDVSIPHTRSVLARRPPDDDPMRQVFALLLHALQSPPSPPVAESLAERPAYVDKTEALAIAGVSYGALRAAVQAGEVKQRGRRYRRTDLEAL
jgi:hypothetical protein